MYIDLVLVKYDAISDPRLFMAPFISAVNKGDTVVVDTAAGERKAKVINVMSINTEREEYAFIIDATGATLPLKRVLSKVTRIDLNYKEYEGAVAE